jgi:hypothetical protein
MSELSYFQGERETEQAYAGANQTEKRIEKARRGEGIFEILTL